MAGITQRTATIAENSSTQSIAATLPSDRVNNDVTIALFSVPGTPAQLTAPSGWTAVFAATDNGAAAGETICAYWRINPPGNPTVSTTGTAGRATAICQSFGGVDTTTPIDIVGTINTPGGVTSITLAGVTTTKDGALLISVVNCDTSSRPFVHPSGMTNIQEYSAASNGRALVMDGEVRATAGATGTKTWSMNPSATLPMAGVNFALRPGGNTWLATGSITATGVMKKVVGKKWTASITPGAGVLTILKTVPKAFAGSITAAGTLVKQVRLAVFTGSVTPGPGAFAKVMPKRFTGSVTPGPGIFHKAFPRLFSGSITVTGNVVFVALGRVFGRPGRAVVKAYKAAEAVLRIRRT